MSSGQRSQADCAIHFEAYHSNKTSQPRSFARRYTKSHCKLYSASNDREFRETVFDNRREIRSVQIPMFARTKPLHCALCNCIADSAFNKKRRHRFRIGSSALKTEKKKIAHPNLCKNDIVTHRTVRLWPNRRRPHSIRKYLANFAFIISIIACVTCPSTESAKTIFHCFFYFRLNHMLLVYGTIQSPTNNKRHQPCGIKIILVIGRNASIVHTRIARSHIYAC